MRHVRTAICLLLSFAILPAGLGLRSQADENEPSGERLEIGSLPNAIRFHEKVISGGLPAGEAGFAALRELGVRTIVSVDGARPDVELAKRFGLRYVHLPHGYDGIAPRRGQELSKAILELPGPIYIHCHHGKHRSPAAAAVACVGAGLLEANGTTQFLEFAGTSKNYQGLYASAKSAKRWSDADLRNLEVEFRSVVKVAPMAESMVAIEQTFDHLHRLAENDWKTLPAHPDLKPAHEALLLREHFVELLRTDDVKQRPPAFRRMTEDSIAAARSLEKSLRELAERGPAVNRLRHASQQLNTLNDGCKSCHRVFRDNPSSGKLP